MKSLIIIKIASGLAYGLLLLILLAGKAKSQTLDFIYAAPTATMDANFNDAQAFTRVHNGTVIPLMTGYRYVRVVPANVGTFRTTAPPILRHTYDSITNANSRLRKS